MSRPSGQARVAPMAPIAAGGALALASAVAFGVSTPMVQRLGRGVGPFTTAALLYLGSALLPAAFARGSGDRSLRARDMRLVVIVAALGAVLGPVALAWGLQRTSGVTAALLLNLEGLFTVLLARSLWSEPVGGRVALALAAMTSGGALLVLGRGVSTPSALLGDLAVLAATAAWAADSTLGRPLSERDPAQVVTVKSSLGALASGILALASGEAWPSARAALGLAACGAVGYGASLIFYLRAQRTLGAARTGSIFASAPFVGAAVAWGMGEAAGGPSTLAAGALCAFGVALHMTERHAHEHRHDPVEHEHPHTHDDLHHAHHHDAYPQGAHSHRHAHEAMTHAHAHGMDEHHRHKH